MKKLLLLAILTGPFQGWAVDFAHQVMPILKKHCAECHTGEKKKGGLSMNTRDALLASETIVLGKAADSLFVQLIESDDDEEYMPPKGDRLSAREIATLKAWINANAPWEPGIALGESGWEPPLKPRSVNLPPARDGRPHPIDRILDADLGKRKVPLPAKADDAAFLRRAYLDAIGLLPTPDQLTSFLADSSDDKRERLIDRLLADDIAYADHWLTTWNDLLRNGYTGTGFIDGGRKKITEWLYASLRENKPYDQFARELIAPTPASSGFIDGIKWRGEVNSSQTREIQFSQNISQVFLGINMKCASCHDSFIDRWTLSEAYNLAAIYANHPLELNRCDKPTGKMATPKWIFPEIGDIDPKAPREQRLKQLAALMTHPDNGRFSRTIVNRIWHRLMGRGIVHPVDAMDSKPWNEDLLDFLAVQFAKDGYDLRRFIRFVMTSEAYQANAVVLAEEPGAEYAYSGPIAKRMTAEQFMDSIWQLTGTHPANANEKVDRSPALDPTTAEAAPRLKPTPITAHWIWHAGPVGKRSQLRTTFDLTDIPEAAKMAATCDNAFRMKINGKLVATSKDWQKPVYIDVADHLKKGSNTITVDAEMFGGAAGLIVQLRMLQEGQQRELISDTSWEARPPGGTWAAAAALHPYDSGPWGQNLIDPGKLVQAAESNAFAPPVRASLVHNDFLMRSLGRPNREQVVSTRPNELSTLQAIDLSNGDILASTLQQGARNVGRLAPPETPLTDWLYRYALSREPTEHERGILNKVVADGSDPLKVEDLLWLVIMQPEFQVIR